MTDAFLGLRRAQRHARQHAEAFNSSPYSVSTTVMLSDLNAALEEIDELLEANAKLKEINAFYRRNGKEQP